MPLGNAPGKVWIFADGQTGLRDGYAFDFVGPAILLGQLSTGWVEGWGFDSKVEVVLPLWNQMHACVSGAEAPSL
jgi:hypothetical protein